MQRIDGPSKANSKLFKVQHLQSGRIFAMKELEANNLDKLNEYKDEAM